jgi:hypothetical protein
MKNHFLVTISSDADHLFGVRFTCSFFNILAEHTLTLLHICRLDSNDMEKTLLEIWRKPDEKIYGEISIKGRKSLEKAKQLLSQTKIHIDQVITKTVAERYGKVHDILAEGSRGLYDAIILGRRATYALQWMYEKPGDELAQAMIRDNNCPSPLWICPDPEPGRKNVLLCVDGSEDGYRAVDHVGYIVSNQEQHSITLFNVGNGLGGDVNDIFKKAEWILQEHGIGSERIKRIGTWGLTVAGSILSESARGGYAAVAVGMHGQEHGLLKDFNLVGGTTAKLISKIEKASLWCCP